MRLHNLFVCCLMMLFIQPVQSHDYADPAAVKGSSVQPYKYNGKELDRMHGLDWYDYGARWMDAALGRWHGMDPLCEKYYDVSPYVYCLNNPIGNTDPDERSVWTKGAKIALKVGAKVFRNGLKELGKAANYADAVSDITDNVKTLFDSNASTTERIGAGLSLVSEALPVSIGDVKDVNKTIKVVNKQTHFIKPNNGIAKPHGGKNHNERIDKMINKRKS